MDADQADQRVRLTPIELAQQQKEALRLWLVELEARPEAVLLQTAEWRETAEALNRECVQANEAYLELHRQLYNCLENNAAHRHEAEKFSYPTAEQRCHFEQRERDDAVQYKKLLTQTQEANSRRLDLTRRGLDAVREFHRLAYQAQNLELQIQRYREAMNAGTRR
jgi:hypothetical protein